MMRRVFVVVGLAMAVGGLVTACHDSAPATPSAKPSAPAAKAAAPTSSSPAGQAALAALKTTAEASDYKSTSSYEDVVTFMKAVADAAPQLVHYTTYGTTSQNRAM